jgi:GT2 family glycosyltransferase
VIALSSGRTYQLLTTSTRAVSIAEPDGYSLVLSLSGEVVLTVPHQADGPVALAFETLAVGESEVAAWIMRKIEEGAKRNALLQTFLAANLPLSQLQTRREEQAVEATRNYTKSVDKTLMELDSMRLADGEVSMEDLKLLLAKPASGEHSSGKPILVAVVGPETGQATTLQSLEEVGEGPWVLVDSADTSTAVAVSKDLQDHLAISHNEGSEPPFQYGHLGISQVLYVPSGARLLPGWLTELRRLGEPGIALLGGIEAIHNEGDIVLYGELDPVLLTTTPAFGLAVAFDLKALGSRLEPIYSLTDVWCLVASVVARGCSTSAADAIAVVSPPWPVTEIKLPELMEQLDNLIEAEVCATETIRLPRWPHIVLRHKLKLSDYPDVSVIIPTHDAPEELSQALESIWKADYPSRVEVILVAHRVTNEAVLGILKAASEHGARIVFDKGGFNFSRLVNRGAAVATGDLLLLMNDDVYAADPNWLRELVTTHIAHKAAVTGAKLLTSDNQRIQHLGQVRSALGTLQHLHVGMRADHVGYCGRGLASASVIAVTGALMVIEATRFSALGGLDETFTVAFGDSDLALRLKSAHERVVLCATASAVHHEQTTRGSDAIPARFVGFASESLIFRHRHGYHLATDRSFSPLLRGRDSLLEINPAAALFRSGLIGIPIGPEDMGGGADVILLPSDSMKVSLYVPEDMPEAEIFAVEINGLSSGGEHLEADAYLDNTKLSMWSPNGGEVLFRTSATIPTKSEQLHELLISINSGWMKLRLVPSPTQSVMSDVMGNLKYACAATVWAKLI